MKSEKALSGNRPQGNNGGWSQPGLPVSPPWIDPRKSVSALDPLAAAHTYESGARATAQAALWTDRSRPALIVTRELTCADCNAIFERSFGATRDEVQGAGVQALFSGAAGRSLHTDLKNFFRSGASEIYVLWRAPDHEDWISVRVRSIFEGALVEFLTSAPRALRSSGLWSLVDSQIDPGHPRVGPGNGPGVKKGREEVDFGLLVDQLPTGVFVILDGVFKYANPELAAMLDQDCPDVLTSGRAEDFVHPDDRALFRDNLRRCARGEVAQVRFEFRGKTPGKIVPHLELLGSRMTYGKREAVHGTIRDIGDQKRLFTALEHSQNRLSTVLETASDRIYAMDLRGRYVYVSSAATRVTGYTPEEFMRGEVTLDRYIHSADHDQMTELYRRVRSGEPIRDVPLRIVRKDGATRWVSVSLASIRNSEGEFLGIQGIERDITDRMELEKALRDSEARYRTMVETTQTLTLMVDPDGKLTFVSPASDIVLDLAPEEVLGNSVYDLIHHDDHEWLREAMTRIWRGEVITGSELRLQGKDGRWRTLLINGRVLPALNGSRRQALLSCMDITDRKRQDEEIRAVEAKFHSFVENIPGVVFRCIVGTDLSIVFVSPTSTRREGDDAEHAIPSSCVSLADIVHPDDLPRLRNAVAALGGEKKALEEEVRLVASGSGERIGCIYARGCSDADADVTYLDGVIIDVTRRKEIEANLARRTRELELLNEIGSALSHNLDHRVLGEATLAGAATLLGMDVGLLYNLGPSGEKLELVASTGIPDGGLDLLRSREVTDIPVQQEGGDHSPVCCHSVDGERCCGLCPPLESLGMNTVLWAPFVSNGSPCGLIAFAGRMEGDVSPRLMELFSTLSAGVGMACVKARLYQQSINQARHVGAFNDIMARVSGVLDPARLFGEVVELIRDHLQADRVLFLGAQRGRGNDRVLVAEGVAKGVRAAAGGNGKAQREQSEFIDQALKGPGFLLAQTTLEAQSATKETSLSRRMRSKTFMQAVWDLDASAPLVFRVDRVKNERRWSDEEISFFKETSGFLREAYEKCLWHQSVLESERQYRTIFDNAVVGIFHCHAAGEIITVNNTLAEMLGYDSPDGLVGKNLITDLIGDKSFGRHFKGRRQSPAEFECSLKKQDGSALDVRVTRRRVSDKTTGAARWEGIIENLSESKRMEMRMRQLRNAIESTADAVMITDHRGQIEYVNPAFEMMSGYRHGEVVGKTPRLLKSGKHSQEIYGELWETILTGQVWKGQMVNRRKNGDEYTVDMTVAPVKDRSGVVSHFVAVERDVTEQKDLERRLFQAQKMESLGTLAGGIAHDFNNLLGGIVGTTSILLGSMSARSKYYRPVQTIEKTALRAAELVKQLMGFAREGQFQMQPLQINEILGETIGLLKSTIDKRVAVKDQLARRLPLIEGDASQIQQAIMNLCINARDAMPRGGTLRISSFAHNGQDPAPWADGPLEPIDYVGVAIEDDGMGMDSKTVERIFDPFFTTKEQGKGTGLGLAMVYGIAKSHQGHIFLASQPGRGTKFRLLFPALAGSVAKVKPTAGPAKGGTETILLVDDETVMLETVAEILRGGGYTVIPAKSGVEAIQRFVECPDEIDMVILDMVMHDVNGREALHALRQEKPGVRVLLSTGFSTDTETVKALADGALGFIQKPFGRDELFHALRKVLDG